MEREGLNYFRDFILIRIFIGKFANSALKGRKVMPIVFVRVTRVQVVVRGANDSINFALRESPAKFKIVRREIFGITESVLTEHECAVHIKQQCVLPGKHSLDSVSST